MSKTTITTTTLRSHFVSSRDRLLGLRLGCILLEGENWENGVAALLSGLGSLLVRVELAWSAAEVALKGAMMVLMVPVLLEVAWVGYD